MFLVGGKIAGRHHDQGAVPADVRAESVPEWAGRPQVSGGFIKVACERAAYVAGAAGTEIDEALLRQTIERMYRERGKLSAVGPLE